MLAMCYDELLSLHISHKQKIYKLGKAAYFLNNNECPEHISSVPGLITLWIF